jgi:CheY-like chemotaxis protein
LLSNAVKFTNQGSVTFGFDANGADVGFFISDTGIGIENEALEMVLDAFVQEDMKISRNYEGSGLGLSIARGIIHKLGGELRLESEKGKGTHVRFSLAAGSKMPGQINPEPEKTKKSAKQPLILIAEDDLSNYLYLEVLLKKSGIEVLHAKNGSEAVVLCKQHPGINLVLMDIKMPVMDGLEATKHIKEIRPELPVIAITAYAQTGDEFRIRQAGCDGYLAKPVKMNDLKVLINNVLG